MTMFTRSGKGVARALMPGLLPGFFVGVLALTSSLSLGCASSSGGEKRVTVVKGPETPAAEVGGIPPDKQAEIQLVLQQRDSATTKCYADVLNEKHDRSFKGHVAVLITVQPDGTASDVKIVSSNLNSQDVTDCLIEKLKTFEYPQLEHAGSMQYVYHFEPAY